MEDRADTYDAIWATTTDGGLLQQLFGYTPSMHDAVIRNVCFEGGVLTLDVIYLDRPESGEKDLRVQFSMEFSGSVEAELPMEESDICSFTMARSAGRVQADFAFCAGEFGKVRANQLEVRLSAVDPLIEDEPRRLRIC